MNKKKLFKNVLKGIGIFVLTIALAAVAIPYFFKDRILAEAKKIINENVRATVDFGEVGVSMFRSFPDVTLRLEDFTVEGINEFKGVRLAAVKAFEVRLDIMSIIKGEEMEIERIALKQPNLYVKVLKNGAANYDIAIPSEELDTMTTEPTPFKINLDGYSIEDGTLIYDDLSAGVWVEIEALNHSGTGSFTEAIYDLETKTTADAFTAEAGGIAYLSKVKTDIDMTLNINMNEAKYTFKENSVNLNALQLNFDGYVAMPTDDIEMDIRFDSPQSDFKAILSMIPAAYTADFSGVQASGKMSLKGTAKGIYNESSLPALDLDLAVNGGSFKYPDLPLGVSNINVLANVKSPNSDMDNMVVNVSKFHIELDKNPFDAKFLLKKPMSDPDVTASVKGKIDLAKLSKAFPMDGVKTLNGIIDADVAAKMRLSDVTNERYEDVNLNGKLQIANMNYIAEGTPSVKIRELNMDFTPKNIQLTNFDANIGKSDMQLSGYVDNPLTYFSGEKVMSGDLVFRSKLLDLNDMMGGSEPSKVQNPDADATPVTTEEPVFDKFSFNADAEIGTMVYDVYKLKNMKAKGSFTPQLFDIQQFAMNLGKTDLQATGQLNNVFGYVFDGEEVRGNVKMKANVLDLNDLMAMGETTSAPTSNTKTKTETPAPEPEGDVFGRFNIAAEADAKSIIYDVYDLKNLTAKGVFTEREFKIENFKTQIGKSDMNGGGTITNALNYAFKSGETVSGVLNLNANVLDLNDLMAMGETTTTPQNKATATTTTETTEPTLVPADMNFNIQGNFGKVIYDNLVLDKMVGEIIVKDEKIAMNNVRMNTLGGSMALNGNYDTKNHDKPKFEFAYDVKQFKFDESVKQLSSFKYILPIAEYLQGRFNSQLTMGGELGKDMMPKWETLNAKGILETIQTAIKGHPTLSKITNQLNVSNVNPLLIEDSKNIITIKNGLFSIQPFDFKFKDILFNVSGNHAIQGAMDYVIKTKIPRALLNKNPLSSAANTGLDLLSGQASKLGINLAQGDYINVDILLTGPIKSPKYSLKLAGTEGKKEALEDAAKQKLEQEAERLKKEAEAELQKQKQALENKAKAEADKLKKEAEARAKAEADKLKKEAEAKIKAETDRLKKEAEERLKKELGNRATEAAKQRADSLQAEINKRLDADAKRKLDEQKKKIQDELDKLNPFKKKKDGN